MKFLDALKLRYSTKRYDPSKLLDDATISQIAEILRLTPSSINSQPWQFTLLTDSTIKAKLAENSFFNKSKIEDAPLLVVFSVCNRVEEFEERISKELPQPNVDYYNNVVKPHGKDAIECWMSCQLYISVGVLLSACATMGIDATPMEGIDSNIYDSILESDGYHAVVAVAVGYRSEADKNQPTITPKERRPADDVLVFKGSKG